MSAVADSQLYHEFNLGAIGILRLRQPSSYSIPERPKINSRVGGTPEGIEFDPATIITTFSPLYRIESTQIFMTPPQKPENYKLTNLVFTHFCHVF